MRKVFSTIVVFMTVLMLATIFAVPVMAADTGDVPASATLGATISITITDEPETGITFGSVAQASTDNADQTTIPLSASVSSVTVNVEIGTTVNVDLQVSGTVFTGSVSGTIAISNAKWDTVFSGTPTAMSTTPTEFADTVAPGGTQQLWHWLDVPALTPSGTYTSTFTYTAVEHVI